MNVRTFKNTMIYIFKVDLDSHKGLLKIGESTAPDSATIGDVNTKALNARAHKRIRVPSGWLGVDYHLLHTEVCVTIKDGKVRSFGDGKVHNILERSGVGKHVFDKAKGVEWFRTDLATAKKAIKAAKDGKDALNSSQITEGQTPITFRPEQEQAIEKTVKTFKRKSNQKMLWNAKMRFGKTLCALEVVKRANFKRTLILTHRPVVDKGWFDNYKMIFYDRKDFGYTSKTYGNELTKQLRSKGNLVCFASMQDLRGTDIVGGRYQKNKELFAAKWDCIIIDEAHEGTQTELGKEVLSQISTTNSKELYLSGTPFNIQDEFDENNTFRWDYVDEQRAKNLFDFEFPVEPNPYASLPRMNINTYKMGELVERFAGTDIAFTFREFFRVKDDGKFMYEAAVQNFLDTLTKSENYPFSNQKYREEIRHSLWMVPGVKAAKALSVMLKSHAVFAHYQIANVAGDGDEEQSSNDAMKMVRNAIGNNPHQGYSITISCGRLTTGVTVPEWTAVLMLAGTYSTSVSSYMQTIFRVQSPAVVNGEVKQECYVFDFAPDRSLRVIAEIVKVSKKKTTREESKKLAEEFMNFCPIISYDGAKMKRYDAGRLITEIKKIQIENVVKSGFENGYLYDRQLLAKLTKRDLSEFENLQKSIGKTKASHSTHSVDLNQAGLTDATINRNEELKAQKKAGKKLTKAEIAELEKLKQINKNRDAAISILRGISIRMPLMIYGAEMTDREVLTIDNFTQKIDDKSWEEFLPKKVSKKDFEKFKKYYDPDVFMEAGKRIREMAREADKLGIEQRIVRIAAIFGSFRNPDKETVLTPWGVVNRHISECLGGYVFENISTEEDVFDPKLVKQRTVTDKVFSPDSRILEINSKTGLYPLFMAYGIYRARLKSAHPFDENVKPDEQYRIWDKVLKDNIFVLCKTPMAASITQRTLGGFRKVKSNIKCHESMERDIINNPETMAVSVSKGKDYWKSNKDNNMKFNAIVGNPPYQEMDGGNKNSATSLYHHFVRFAKKVKPKYISLIMPARWYAGGKGLDQFRQEMLSDKSIVKLFDFENTGDIFPNVDIAGGVCYFLMDKDYKGQTQVINHLGEKTVKSKRYLDDYSVLIRHRLAIPIIEKTNKNSKRSMAEVVSARKPFGIDGNHTSSKNGIPCYFTQKRGVQNVNPQDITDTYKYLDKYKLLVPRAPIAGQTNFAKPVAFYYESNIRIAKPGECCTESWLVIFSSSSLNEVHSFKSYLRTKIFRFLLLQTVVSQDVTRENFRFVPAFDNYRGVYTDMKLRTKWSITDEEWEFIDSKISD